MAHVRRPVRTRAALVATALVVSAGLSSCGFNYATDQIYNASTGTNSRTGDVSVLSAVVVAAQDDRGTFLATFNNNSLTKDDGLTAMSAGAGSPDLQVSAFEPVPLDTGGFANLADTQGITVTGDFIPGDYVDLVMDFESADSVEMSVPVVADAYEYAGLDTSSDQAATGDPSASATPAE